jgi:Rieske Fe-S protein
MSDRVERGLVVEWVARPARRDFLVIGGGAAVAVAAGACSGAQVVRDAIGVGSTSDFASGTVTLVEAGPVLVGHDDGGLYAMSARCTHLGCAVTVEGDRLPCPCHGSAFDLQGAVLAGPASRPLEHYRVTVEGDTVTVDTRETVEPSTRAPLS